MSTLKKAAAGIDLTGLIDTLSDSERRRLRETSLALGASELPRNLYYNYTTQSWID